MTTTHDSYDRLAEAYTRHLAGELAGKPFDREALDRFAEAVWQDGWVCDAGCGPGHVGAYLADRGARVVGLDDSLLMLRHAGGVERVRADFSALPLRALAGIVAFYAIVHLLPAELEGVFREWRRALRPGGRLLLAFHVGEEVVHRDELWETPVSLDFVFHLTVPVTASLARAGFQVLEARERDPYPEVEYPSRRAYVVARV